MYSTTGVWVMFPFMIGLIMRTASTQISKHLVKSAIPTATNGNGCIMPQNTANGTYSLRGSLDIEGGKLAPHNSILKLTCPPGYVISSDEFNFCDDSKNDWFHDLATCQKMCKPPKSLTVIFTCSVRGRNGQINKGSCDSMLPSGSTASGECRKGHRSINVHRHITCIDGRWGYSMPRCKAECGQATPLGKPNVINGTNAARGEFPWHTAIYTQYGQEGKNLLPRYWCGGSIISRDLVISAAHCFYDPRSRGKFDTDLFTIAVGKVHSEFAHSEEAMDNFIQKTGVKRIEIPEDYEGESTSFSHDLALLVLKNPFTLSNIIMPVCLNLLDKDFDEEQSSPGLNAKVAGFGLTQVNGDVSNVLKTAVMPIISKNQCKSESPQQFSKYIIWDKLCAGQTNGIGVCKGDSGGGLVVSSLERNNPTWYLRGIVSTSPTSDNNDQCSTNTYSTFTRPFLHKDFIEDVIYQQGCVMPNNPANGKFVLVGLKNMEPGQGVAHKSQMTLSCNSGFVASDADNNICDEFINDWIKDFATCNAVIIANEDLPQRIDSSQDGGSISTDLHPTLLTRPVKVMTKPVEIVTRPFEIVTPTSTRGMEIEENEQTFVRRQAASYKMFCYFTNWAWYRPGVGKYSPEEIDVTLCTHIVYGFAVLDAKTFNIRVSDHWADIDNRFYEKVTAYKLKGVKVILGLGGLSDSEGNKYSRLVNDAKARQDFANYAMEFLTSNNFDGLHLDWEYPVCWQGQCNNRASSDNNGFSVLVKELHQLFVPNNLLLLATISPKKHIIDVAYDIPNLSKNLDWLAVTAYDYHGALEAKTGHIAPLYEHPDDDNHFLNINYTINYLISKGASRSKLVLGLPFFGRSFSLRNSRDNGLNSPARKAGKAGNFTNADGYISYYEICNQLKNHQWKVVRDMEGRMGPYAYNEDQWISFDDVKMIRQKVSYLKSMGLAGAMVWALDLDDFRGTCGCEAYPLLSAAARGLNLIKTPQPTCA